MGSCIKIYAWLCILLNLILQNNLNISCRVIKDFRVIFNSLWNLLLKIKATFEGLLFQWQRNISYQSSFLIYQPQVSCCLWLLKFILILLGWAILWCVLELGGWWECSLFLPTHFLSLPCPLPEVYNLAWNCPFSCNVWGNV